MPSLSRWGIQKISQLAESISRVSGRQFSSRGPLFGACRGGYVSERAQQRIHCRQLDELFSERHGNTSIRDGIRNVQKEYSVLHLWEGPPVEDQR